MQTLNQSLFSLYARRFISLEEALMRSIEVDELKMMIEQRSQPRAGGPQQRG